MHARLLLVASALLASAAVALLAASCAQQIWGLLDDLYPYYGSLIFLVPALHTGAMQLFFVGMYARRETPRISRTTAHLIRVCLLGTLAALFVGGAGIMVLRVRPEWSQSTIFVVVAITLPYAIGWLAAGYMRVPKQGSCLTCEYELTGNVSGRCPECGTPIAAGTEAAAPARPPEVKNAG